MSDVMKSKLKKGCCLTKTYYKCGVRKSDFGHLIVKTNECV